MNFILRFFNKKLIRIAGLEKLIARLDIAAASHAREIGGHRASHTVLKKQMLELKSDNQKLKYQLLGVSALKKDDVPA